MNAYSGSRNFLPGSSSGQRLRHSEAGFPVFTVRRTVLAALATIELLVLLAAFTKPAYGYVDPGSGLLAFQVGGSMLAGGLFILRSKIRKLFRMSSPPPEEATPEESTPTETAE